MRRMIMTMIAVLTLSTASVSARGMFGNTGNKNQVCCVSDNNKKNNKQPKVKQDNCCKQKKDKRAVANKQQCNKPNCTSCQKKQNKLVKKTSSTKKTQTSNKSFGNMKR